MQDAEIRFPLALICPSATQIFLTADWPSVPFFSHYIADSLFVLLVASHIRLLKIAKCKSDIREDCLGASDNYRDRLRHGDETCIFVTVNTCQNVICNKYIYTFALSIVHIFPTSSAGFTENRHQERCCDRRDGLKKLLRLCVTCLMQGDIFWASVYIFVMYNSGMYGNVTFKNK